MKKDQDQAMWKVPATNGAQYKMAPKLSRWRQDTKWRLSCQDGRHVDRQKFGIQISTI